MQEAGAECDPQRAGLETTGGFEAAGRAVLDQHRLHPPGPDARTLGFDLRAAGRLQRELYESALRADAAGEHITTATRWLLDNYHILAEAYRHLQRDMGPGFLRSLPREEFTPGGLMPRVLALAWDHVAMTDADLREACLSAYIGGAQQVSWLTIGELWSLPSMLRYVLLQRMLRLSEETERSRHGRREANAAMDRLMAVHDPRPEDFDRAVSPDALRDPAFVAQLVYRIHAGLDRSHVIAAELASRLEAQGQTAEQILVEEQSRQTANNVTAANVVRALRRIDEIDWRDWFEAMSRVEAILREDPDHLRLSPATRNTIRERIETIARYSDLSEVDVATRALAAAEQQGAPVSVVLLGDGAEAFEHGCGYRPLWRERLRRRLRRWGIWAVIVPLLILSGTTAGIGLWLLPAGTSPWLAALLVVMSLPAFIEAGLALVRFLASRTLTPARLPAYGFEDGIPPDQATLVVIPCLLTGLDGIDDLLGNLEVHYLANTDRALSFALLTDFTDAETETTPRDAELLAYTRAGIETLARKYAHTGGRRFYLLHRRRQWNESEGVWMGWERKRGKLVELNALLRGSHDTSFVDTGPRPPAGIRHVVTLDADTRMPRGTVRRLVGMMAHPVNRPHYDPALRRVTRGHGLIQPRVTAMLAHRRQTSPFQRILSADGGLDPYVFTVSDLWQDLFDQGTYTGKGIYDVDAFIAAAQDHVRENTVLSHDLIEGAWLRAALATDVTFLEEYPRRFDVDLSRQHRWARGDWQLLPYLLDFTNGLDGLARLRMIDNLRRTMLPGGLMMAGLVALTGLPVGPAMHWLALLGVSISAAQLLGWVMGLVPRQPGVSPLHHAMVIGGELIDQLVAFMLRLALLPQIAFSMADAIIRSLYRIQVSRRHMLEWTTAEAAAARGPETLAGYLSLMRGGVAITGIFTLLVAALRPGNIEATLPFTILWLGAPLIAWISARPVRPEGARALTPAERLEWRAEARLIWRFFESFVTEATHHLPPDNFQFDPEPRLAERSSPTNIGLYLLSVATAREFQWITLDETLGRIEATLDTMSRMERRNGHLYNWYRTDTLEPIGARYISSVDSGNLAGHLVTLAATLREWARNPALYLLPDLSGAADILFLMRRQHRAIPRERRSLDPLRRRIDERIDTLWRSISQPEGQALHVETHARAAADLHVLIEGLLAEQPSDATRELEWWAGRLVSTCDAMASLGRIEPAGVERAAARMIALAERARAFAFGMEFGFLFDSDRNLLTVGYNCDEGRADNAFYDLLASEARLASLFAIAKGDVPDEHWDRLGRPMTAMPYGGTLVSWSGSMFEYLMAPLVMDEPPGSILNSSCRVAVEAHIRDGQRHGRPWGVSESAYNARDELMNYQYHAFGVPELALRRWLRDDQVVAPYASFLAAELRPRSALRNLRRLAAMGARSEFGFCDAVDFTPARLPEGSRWAVVRNVMAHHQGMSLLAVANCLMEGIHRDRFHSDAVIESVSTLLQHRAPREVSALLRDGLVLRPAGATEPSGGEVVGVPDTRAAPHTVAVMSNGRLSLMVDASGAGRLRRGPTAITRWRPDPADDSWGEFVFLRDAATGRWWSATAAPCFDPEIACSARIFDYKANFTATGNGILADTEVILSDDLDARGTRIKLRNTSDQVRQIEVTSYGEIVLDDLAADRAHTVFSRMFVATEAQPENGRILARRNKRNPSEPDRHLMHLVTGAGVTTGAATDRRAFVGRGRTIRAPLAMVDPATRTQAPAGEDFTLDPIFSLTRRVTLDPGKEAVINFWTVFAEGRAALDDAHRRLADEGAHDLEHHMAWTRSRVQLHHAGITPEEAALFRRYAALLVWPNEALNPHRKGPGMGQQSALWPIALSGDHPIMVLRLNDPDLLPLAHQAIRMQEYLRMRGLETDLVLLNERRASYGENLNEALTNLCHSMHLLHSRPSVFAVDGGAIEPATRDTLLAAARIVLHAQNGNLASQIARLEAAQLRRGLVRPAARALQRPRLRTDFPREELRFWNGTGGFDAEGNYVIRLRHGERTPNPWINVIARSDFGFHISAEGTGYSWSANSRDHQLTPWSNDPVSDPPGEGLLIRDLGTGAIHTPSPALSSQQGALYECRHGAGWTRQRAWSGELEITATHSLMPDRPLRLIGVELVNRSDRRLVLDVAQFLEPVMGQSRGRSAPYLQARFLPEARAIECVNPYSIDHPDHRMILSVDREVTGMCLSRLVWLGRNRDHALPAWYDSTLPHRFVHRTDADPLMMLETRVEIAPGERAEITFRLAAGPGAQATHAIALALPAPAQVQGAGAGTGAATGDGAEDGAGNGSGPAPEVIEPPIGLAAALAATGEHWQDLLGRLQVETPDPAFDLMVNRWLPYQAIACRIRARSAFWQASGAYGFRDQLQDTSAMLLHDPSLARAQLLEAASRQFPEGDVQHWWLPESGAGVRTTIADDVVWLGHALARYVAVTGDRAILDERVPFIEGRALEPGEHDAFFRPEVSARTASVWEHAALALELAIRRTGDKGLPLFLGGDWNDGMNRVGAAGRGQSVWLGWFLAATIDMMRPLAEARGEHARAAAWAAHRAALGVALDHHAWDGDWYLRGIYDDGSLLGSHLSDECQIDSIAQSWAVISAAGREDRRRLAIDSALTRLLDERARLLRLFTPPFAAGSSDPGYIRGYPPGVRENGGQYTHAAIWMVQALAMAGRAEDAWRVFDILNPVTHATDPASVAVWRGEPYVIPADVYGEASRTGRAGWTWYTGSAGWMLRVAVEHILGITVRDGTRVEVNPALPPHWPGYRARLLVAGRPRLIEVMRGPDGTVEVRQE